MYKIGIDEFDCAYTILKDAFVSAELRPYSLMKEFFIKEDLLFYGIKKDGVLSVVLLCWEFDDFVFLENFAVLEKFRNQGLGTLCLSEIKQKYTLPIVLEVEKPYDAMSMRRIEFYKRIGFCLTQFGYNQPPYCDVIEDIPLLMMSYPNKISESIFYQMKNQIFARVYKKRP